MTRTPVSDARPTPAPAHQATALERMLAAGRTGHRAARVGTAGRVLLVASGKGGVGKTNLAVNLAVALQQGGRRVLLLDADVGLGDVETLCGIHCGAHLADVLAGRVSLEDAIEPGPADIWCAAGGTAVSAPAALDRAALRRLLGGLGALRGLPDDVVLDLPAGLGEGVRSSLLAARDVLLLTTPEPTALADAYAVIKATLAGNRAARFHVVVNMCTSADDGRKAFQRLQSAAGRFLGCRLRRAGLLPADGSVARAVRQQVPFLLGAPLAPASRAVRRLAASLTRGAPGPQPLSSFLYRLARDAQAGEVEA